MRYTLLLVLSAVALASIGANSAHADRVAYDILGDARPSVGDDDEPFVTAPPTTVVEAAGPIPVERKLRDLLWRATKRLADSNVLTVALRITSDQRVAAR